MPPRQEQLLGVPAAAASLEASGQYVQIVSPTASSRYSLALLAGITIMFGFGCVCAIVLGVAISGTLRIQPTDPPHVVAAPKDLTLPWHHAFRFASAFSCNAYLVQAIVCLAIAMVVASCPSVVVIPRSKVAFALYLAIFIASVGSAVIGFSSVTLANEWLLVKFVPATAGGNKETAVAHGYHYALCASQYCAANASSLPTLYSNLGVVANSSAVSSSQTIGDVCAIAGPSSWPDRFLRACLACTGRDVADDSLLNWSTNVCQPLTAPNVTAIFCTRVLTAQDVNLPELANFTTPYKSCRRPLLNAWTYYAKRVAGGSTILATATLLFMAAFCRRPQKHGLVVMAPPIPIMGSAIPPCSARAE
ncbi:hypothetical protein DYB32_007208 [Aphanomyces invadans]|nr:hypothetical protein DYB32_007208 [Aphanomyces invadans]